jgi:hypothetical protein
MVSTLERPLCQPSPKTTPSKSEMTRFLGLLSPKEMFCRGARENQYSKRTLVRRNSTKRSQRDLNLSKDCSYETSCRVVCHKLFFLILHFALVVCLLLAAAVVFAYFEKPVSFTPQNNTKVSTPELIFETKLWGLLESKYNVTVADDDRSLIYNEFKDVLMMKRTDRFARTQQEAMDEGYEYKKWFYFASSTATTIGKYFHIPIISQ